MWKEFLRIFDSVVLLEQVAEINELEDAHKPVLTGHVELVEYPSVRSPLQLIVNLPLMCIRAFKAARKADLWILHSPSTSAICLWPWLLLFRIPYSIELRGEQTLNVMYLKGRGIRFARLIVWWSRFTFWLLRSKAIASVAVAQFLANEYPPLSKKALNVAISDSKLSLESYGKPRRWDREYEYRNIVCLGRVEAQKDPFGTMRALALLDQKGFKKWRFAWMGDGPMKAETEKLAKELGLSDRVDFMGLVPWEKVFEVLNTADLYLLYSVSEGLPRSLLEAMACALPSVSTNICGMPELLLDEDLVPPQSDELLANKLFEVLRDSERMTKMSKRNLEKAKEYSAEVLVKKRSEYYQQVKEIASKLNEKKSHT
jgi:glycosyltransferase involved in cell wall biosynthesis